MKDLIAKLKSDATCAMGALWIHMDSREAHIDAQAARIAELEEQQAFGVGETYANALSRIAELEAQIAAASAPADTDKLREVIKYSYELRVAIENAAAGYGEFIDPGLAETIGKEIITYLAASTALQAPVREVPDLQPGVYAVIQLIQKQCSDYHSEHGSLDTDTGVWNYPGDGNEWMCDREELLDEIRALLPATPAQTEGENNA